MADLEFDYDIALSYAGEDRKYVAAVAELLRRQNVKVYYDQFEAANLWGSDLFVLLDEVYRKRARYTVIFISAHYVSKVWTRHERESAQARALTGQATYLLPVRFDDSELPGLRPTVGYIDARNTPPAQLVDLILKKLSPIAGTASARPPILRVPRNLSEQRELLSQRPVAWEYLLYAAVLRQRLEALESKWRDHELGYTIPTDEHFDERSALKFLSRRIGDMSACASNIEVVLSARAQELAFGPSGESGDPVLIDHLATRLVGVYEEVLNIAATIRGARVPDELRALAAASAKMADMPLHQIRAFINEFVVVVDTIPEQLAQPTDEPINIHLSLVITIDEDVQQNLMHQISIAGRKYGI